MNIMLASCANKENVDPCYNKTTTDATNHKRERTATCIDSDIAVLHKAPRLSVKQESIKAITNDNKQHSNDSNKSNEREAVNITTAARESPLALTSTTTLLDTSLNSESPLRLSTIAFSPSPSPSPFRRGVQRRNSVSAVRKLSYTTQTEQPTATLSLDSRETTTTTSTTTTTAADGGFTLTTSTVVATTTTAATVSAISTNRQRKRTSREAARNLAPLSLVSLSSSSSSNNNNNNSNSNSNKVNICDGEVKSAASTCAIPVPLFDGCDDGSPIIEPPTPFVNNEQTEELILPVIHSHGYNTIDPTTMVQLLDGKWNDKISALYVIDCRFPFEYEGGRIKGAINCWCTEQLELHFQLPKIYQLNKPAFEANNAFEPLRPTRRKGSVSRVPSLTNNNNNNNNNSSNSNNSNSKETSPVQQQLNWQWSSDEAINALMRVPFDPKMDASNVVIVFHCEFSQQRGPRMFKFLREFDRMLNQHRYPKLSIPNLYLLSGGYKRFYTEYKEYCSPMGYTPMKNNCFTAQCKECMDALRQQRTKPCLAEYSKWLAN